MKTYSDIVLQHFEAPKNVGTLASDPMVKTATVGNEQSGRIIRLQVKIENDTIVDSKMKVYGDVATIAIASYVSEWLKGKSISEAKRLTETMITKALSLSARQLYSALLAVDAVNALFP